MNWSSIGPLADAIAAAGAPILAAGLHAAAPVAGAAVPLPFAGPVVTLLLNTLADEIGGSASDPDTITARINSDPLAAEAKLKSVEATHANELQNLIDFAKLQSDQNTAELTVTATSWREAWMRFFFAGWRPFAGWTFGAALIAVLWATWHGWEPPTTFQRYFSDTGNIFMLLIGARSTDKIFGVATNSLKAVASSGVSAIVNAVVKRK